MLVEPRLSQPEIDPLGHVQWSKRTSQILDVQGQVIFERDGIEAPQFWSQVAVDVAVSKYLRKSGVPKEIDPTRSESSVRMMIERVVNRIVEAGREQNYFESEKEAEVFSNELKFILIHQWGAFNSPVWFNCGLYQAYGIRGLGGNFRYDETLDKAVECNSAYEYPQSSACFIQSVHDDLMSIFDLGKKEAKIFKYGSGSGTNFSSIRGKQEELEGGGLSSGLMSFLEVLDRGAGATKSGGITRRAAKMVCLNADHPEIFEFVNWKVKEERKAKALIASGFSAHFEEEAYKTVSGQNSNNSVRVTDEFLRRVKEDEEWSTLKRTTGEKIETFPARKLWEAMAQAAWECADPGVQFDTTIQQWNPCAKSGFINASNPCSEYMFLDETACNLASLNLVKFVDAEGRFDERQFSHAARVLFVAQEILIGLSSYPTEEIAENSYRFRPLGLGYCNIGALFMRMGIAYESDEAARLTAQVTDLMQRVAVRTSIDLAKKRGSFAEFTKNKEGFLEVLQLHAEASEHKTQWNQLINDVSQYGVRNAQFTVIAPTGTIGLLMDSDTLGIEPEFCLVKLKTLAGGGVMRLINQSVRPALERLKYDSAQINDIIKYVENEMTIEGAPHLKDEHLAVFDCAVMSGKGQRFISAEGHLKIMAAAQPFLSGAMSKTINLPSSATPENVQQVFWRAWELGLKSVAVYRDGSKSSQPLSRLDENISKGT